MFNPTNLLYRFKAFFHKKWLTLNVIVLRAIMHTYIHDTIYINDNNLISNLLSGVAQTEKRDKFDTRLHGIQCVHLDLLTAGPWYVVLRSTLKSYYTKKRTDTITMS